MNGTNELNLTLENYCLQVYFQEVLLLANQRLQELTQGRYTLEISDEKGRTASNTGLELVIFDDYTGEIRRVQTLSGGESFIVSLALSLSLADVIQQQSGGVQIEALFIDEGFGTLDEQTLQLAIQTLAQLEGQGQMIGIISHVRELKEQIPRQIQVKKLGDGRSEIHIQSESQIS
ncbi:SbcC/MukB-like Walker B domain-containing protein [Enterococcus cecorum]